jgi:hypothetical protein
MCVCLRRYFFPSTQLARFLSFSGALGTVCGWALASPHNRAALQGTPLEALLRHMLAAVQQLAAELADRTVRLDTLHVVVDQPTETMTMLRLAEKHAEGIMGGAGKKVTTGTLDVYHAELSAFDRDLKTVQCFLTTFCNCGVPTQVRWWKCWK